MTTATSEYLASDTDNLLEYKAKISSDLTPSSRSRFYRSNMEKQRSESASASQSCFAIHNHGRLGGTGYLSILAC